MTGGSCRDLRHLENDQKVKEALGELLTGRKGYILSEGPKIIPCPNCKVRLKEGIKFCPECGAKIEEQKPINCPNCKNPIIPGQKFCTECGNKI